MSPRRLPARPHASRSALLLALCCSLWGVPATAAEGEPADRLVMLCPLSDREGSEAAAEAVASQLSDLPVELDTIWIGSLPQTIPEQVELARSTALRREAASVFWIDLTLSDQVFLYVSEPEGERVLVRGVGSGESTLEGRLVTVAVIVRGAVKAILAGGEIGVEPPPARKEPPSVREAHAGRLEMDLGYAAQIYAPEAVVVHGALLGAGVRVVGPLRAELAYRWQAPPRISSNEMVLHIEPHPVELGLALRFPLGRWALQAQLSAVVDIVSLDVTSLDADLQPLDADETRRVHFSLAPALWLGRSFGEVVTIFGRAGVDVVLDDHTYVVDLGEDRRKVVDPWRFRPLFILGAALTIL